MRKRITGKGMVSMILAAVFLIVLSGCGKEELPQGLDPETEARQLTLVAEYAAGLLMKYDKHHLNGLTITLPTDPIEEDPMDITPPEEEEPAPPPGEDPSISISSGGEAEFSEEDVPEPSEMTGEETADGRTEMNGSIAQALGIPEFDVVYTGYETAYSYPESSVSDNMLFSLQADPGKELLILHFNLTNPTGTDLECDPLESSAKIRLLINDTERINQQMTILLNDLKSFSEVVPAGATEDTVLLFYLNEGEAQSIESMTLLIITDEGEYRFAL
ncbi:MAG: hypothetical protein K6G83_09895 [Lachnospiraceae bacterium]|nr:hypothetical protein [Lachnospiraceae bacterium]